MSTSSITKKILSDSLKTLLKNFDLSKISVKDIAQHSGISRNSFYYHFCDKYELINWIFYSEILSKINEFNDPSKCFDTFRDVCEYLYKNKNFYQKCLQYVGQNSLKEYLTNFYFELFSLNINVVYSDMGIKLPKEQLTMMAKMKAFSYVGITEDWIKSGMTEDYIQYYHCLVEVERKEGLMHFYNNSSLFDR